LSAGYNLAVNSEWTKIDAGQLLGIQYSNADAGDRALVDIVLQDQTFTIEAFTLICAEVEDTK
jgi:hypothetical protein